MYTVSIEIEWGKGQRKKQMSYQALCGGAGGGGSQQEVGMGVCGAGSRAAGP